MRLIDADKIKQSVTNEMLKAELNSPVYCTLECVIADIDNQPTAYNVDKVVDRLTKLNKYEKKKSTEYDRINRLDLMDEHNAKAEAYRDSIKIVKSGGIE